jgi:hypothetical protein
MPQDQDNGKEEEDRPQSRGNESKKGVASNEPRDPIDENEA